MNPNEQAKFLEHVGEYFRQQRMDKGYTQNDIAYLVNKSIRWVQKFEKGQIDITLSLFIQVSHFLGVPQSTVMEYFQHFAYEEYTARTKVLKDPKKK
jgi:transcriptional regulator with XRE-family HTH domain